MPESDNGKSRLDRLEETMLTMLESQKANWEEHERIWKAVEALRVSSLEVGQHVKSLTAAIRELIDRIPPEHLR